MVASYRYLGVSNPGLQMLGRGAMSVMFPIRMAPGPHSSISEGFLHSIFSGLRRILGSSNLVNPLFLFLACPVLFCLVLSCPVLLCLVLSCSCLVLSCPVLSCLVLSCPILSCLVLSCPVLSFLVFSCLVLFYPFLSFLVLSCLVLYCPVLFCLVLSCSVLSCLVLSCPVLLTMLSENHVLFFFIHHCEEEIQPNCFLFIVIQGPTFFVVSHMTAGQVYGLSKFHNVVIIFFIY